MCWSGAGKKLRQAARQLAGGHDASDEAAHAFGLASDAIPKVVEIWQECRPAIEVFVACATQWRRAGMDGVMVGIDYGAVEIAARWMEIAITPQIFWDLRVLEDETMAVIAERQK